MDIRVENLEYTYNKGSPLETKALSGISFSLSTGRFLGVLGGTGSGKTTLIKNLNGLLVPTSGAVFIDGTDTGDWGSDLRRQVGVVFQRPERQLFEDTVYQDISFVLRRFSSLSPDEILLKVRNVCNLVGFDLEGLADRSPLSLSKAEQRQVAIAGTLVNEPHVVILDEPAVGLDPQSRAALIRTLHSLRELKNRTVIIVSHDMDEFLPLLDRLMVLSNGTTAAYGTPGDVCKELAADPDLAELLPEVGVLVNDLIDMGLPIPRNEFRAPVLAEWIARQCRSKGGSC